MPNSKHEYSFFDVKKAQKTWIEFFAASKDKKHEFNFWQASKTQKNTD